jgi:hypothetical protein
METLSEPSPIKNWVNFWAFTILVALICVVGSLIFALVILIIIEIVLKTFDFIAKKSGYTKPDVNTDTSP